MGKIKINLNFEVLLNLLTDKMLNLKVVTWKISYRITLWLKIKFPICLTACVDPLGKWTGQFHFLCFGLVKRLKLAHIWLDALVSVVHVQLGNESRLCKAYA